ncbi:ArnT family glycosyltransferase [Ectobacillus panaciterrae]|uniref:ArnT family glycosyltransferase n=1 Tax=Ectobacillus panaciterrae TaxID=363872 RepID=UPI000428F598|nr:glycosyltransferase family 39 protein [Ectobacillus panaciterrae]
MTNRYPIFSNKKNIALLIILFIAAFLRLLALHKYGLTLNINSDDEGYRRSAYIFLEKRMLIYHDPNAPTVHIMPGFTLMLSLVFSIFGKGTLGVYAAKIFMVMNGLLSVFGTYKLGKQIFNGYVGLIASFMLAIFIPQVVIDNLLLTEAPYTAFSIFLFYFSIRLAEKQDWKSFFLVLLFYFSSLYLRPTIALYPILLFIYFIFKKYPIKLMFKQIGIAAIALILVLGPWWIRNYIHFKEFIPLSGGAGDPLLLGTFQGVGYPSGSLNEILKTIDQEHAGEDAYYILKAEEEKAKERIHEWISQSPKTYLYSLLVAKTKLQWQSQFYPITIFQINKETINAVSGYLIKTAEISMLLASLIGKRRNEIIFTILILIYFTLLNNYYFAYDRYTLPLMPIIFIYIGFLINVFISKLLQYTWFSKKDKNKLKELV